MLQLLMVVLAILLLAAVATAGVSYINFDAGQRYVSAQMVSAGFQAWERAYAAYRIANRAEPLQTGDLVPFLPAGQVSAPRGLTWGFGSDSAGAYICLQGETESSNDLAALIRLTDGSLKTSAVPAASVSYGGSCGAVGPLALGQPLAVTYRLAH
jgi:hypothetical protein